MSEYKASTPTEPPPTSKNIRNFRQYKTDVSHVHLKFFIGCCSTGRIYILNWMPAGPEKLIKKKYIMGVWTGTESININSKNGWRTGRQAKRPRTF